MLPEGTLESGDVVLAIDPKNDFFPGGALAVTQGNFNETGLTDIHIVASTQLDALYRKTVTRVTGGG